MHIKIYIINIKIKGDIENKKGSPSCDMEQHYSSRWFFHL